jgi:RNA polymerase sigma-70 factor, ECF subfamily
MSIEVDLSGREGAWDREDHAETRRNQDDANYARLVANLRRGDLEALNCLVELEWLRALQKARREFHDHTAEDVAQEHAIRVWRSWKRWIDLDNPVHFMRRILANVRNDAWRRLIVGRQWGRTGLLEPGGRNNGEGEASGLQPEAPVRDDPAVQAQASEDREAVQEAVRRALALLPESYRRAIELRYFERRKCATIAIDLKTTPGAIYSLLFKARQRLWKLLEPTLGSGDGATNRQGRS